MRTTGTSGVSFLECLLTDGREEACDRMRDQLNERERAGDLERERERREREREGEREIGDK